jgi:hypothetical protein
VLLTFAGGETLSTAVHDNVFWVSDTPAADSGPSTPPAGASPPAPMAMTASFAMTWLDAHGRAVGPPLKRRQLAVLKVALPGDGAVFPVRVRVSPLETRPRITQ